MKTLVLMMLVTGTLFPQAPDPEELETLDTPDALQYVDELLDQLFQPFNLVLADSTALAAHGYSGSAISVILQWQQREESKRNVRVLKHGLKGRDKTLLAVDLERTTWQNQTLIRQRMEYSASLSGWRILNKSRIRTSWGNVYVLTEQDPGEEHLVDHGIISLSTTVFPWFDRLILGDYHINLGRGMILNQQGVRSSMDPRSLGPGEVVSIRPHFSTRETDFYRGLAGTFSQNNWKGTLFVSRRVAMGKAQGNGFSEDSDGIHPAGKALQYQTFSHAGLALETTFRALRFFGSLVYDPMHETAFRGEYGLSSDIFGSHSIQIHTDRLDPQASRMIASWSYASESLVTALQYRRYLSMQDIRSGNVPAWLGSSAVNETGISTRIQLRPIKGLQLRYGLNTSRHVALRSYADLGSIQEHRAQISSRSSLGRIQLDLVKKLEKPVFSGDVWTGQVKSTTTIKNAVSYTIEFADDLQYWVNLKSAYEKPYSGLLMQQRLSGKKGAWKWSIGHVRFSIPDYAVRLSIYETSLAESFSFYTAFDDGQRWFFYLKHQGLEYLDLEFKITQTSSDNDMAESKQLSGGFQMSIVL